MCGLLVPEGMNVLRSIFPSFEKPTARPRYLNIEPERRNFRGIGAVVLLAASCGVALALWEPSQRITSPFVTASTPAATKAASTPAATKAASTPAATEAASQETTAAASVEDDQFTPTAKLSAFCSQRATARRDCASVKAFMETRLTAPDPVSDKADPSVAPDKADPSVAKGPAVEQPEPVSIVAAPAEVPAAKPQRHVARKAKQRNQDQRNQDQRNQDNAPTERLVRVYDQVLPDGRRVPVYRRVGSGGLETGTIVDGEYRSTRRANLEPPGGRLFGLQ
jgi:hypothetical protein